ncbi:MAG: hypothetical protein SFU91_00320 [Chloroherpetonaceae bacterium]|nr:hypothetical protein [Chloroherpetonaceae bacterium]
MSELIFLGMVKRSLLIMAAFVSVAQAQDRFSLVPELNLQNQSGLALCACPRHQSLGNGGETRRLGVSGVMVLDSLPPNSAILTTVRYEFPLSDNETDNGGYKKFFSLLQLKQLASNHGANALVKIEEKRDTVKKILSFEALAVRVVR